MGELRIESCVLITGKAIVYMIYGKTPFGNFFIVCFFFFEGDTFKFAYLFSSGSTSFMKHYPVVSDGGGGLVANLCPTLVTP